MKNPQLGLVVRVASASALCMALLACGSKPPAPDWQLNAKSASDRAVQAYLKGDQRVEQAEFANARAELARTGDADHLARLELLRCAAQVASLVLGPCAGFTPLAQDASPEERAYARYLAGQALPSDIALLPPAQRAVAGAAPAQAAALLTAVEPMSALVAAGVIFTRGQASPALVALAVDKASAQGWPRPLLAWLGVQLQLAQQSGSDGEAARIQRRIDLVAPAPVPSSP